MLPSSEFPDLVTELAQLCDEAGGRAYIVGGSVRDQLMGRPIADWDIEVYGLPIKVLHRMIRRLGNVSTVGRAFSVLKLSTRGTEIDISIPRSDSNIGEGHREFEVKGDPNMTIEEACSRRDLTINAILIDILDGTIIDPFGGQEDIKSGILRPVNANTFLEDPLRALRSVQFIARFGFDASDDLRTLLVNADLSSLPAERIESEWQKLLMKGVRPSLGLTLSMDTGIHQRLFPNIIIEVSTLEALDRAATDYRYRLNDNYGRAYALMLALWLSQSGQEAASQTLHQLRLVRCRRYPLAAQVTAAITNLDYDISSDSALRNLSTQAELELSLSLRHSINESNGTLFALERAKQMGILHQKPTPFLHGRDLAPLAIPPGPDMGQLLKRTYQLQLDGSVENKQQAFSAAKQLHEASYLGMD